MALINEDLLGEFEPNLLSHQISLYGTQIIRVNAYSLATKSGLFLRRYSAATNAEEPLILTPEDVGSMERLQTFLYFCHFDRVRDMKISLLRDALTAAVHFESRQLEQYASDFSCSQLSLESANSIWQQVRTLPDLPVTETVRLFVLRHFLTLAQRADFRDYSADTLVDLLKDERLNAWQEDLLVEPLLLWLRCRTTPLWDQMQLLSSLRFGALSLRSQAALSQMSGFQFFSGFRRSPMFSGMCQPSVPRKSHEVVLRIGGSTDGEFTEEVFCLDPRSGRWARLVPRLRLPESRNDFGCAILGDCRVIVAGGLKASSEGRDFTAECLCLDISDEVIAWRQVANLHEARRGLSTVVCGSVLYVIGGSDSTRCFATVEALEDGTRSGGSGGTRWRLCAPLPEGRANVGLACVAGRVIACGGISWDDPQPLTSVDSYDPEPDQWTRLRPMRHPRDSACLLTLGGEQPQLLVLGGNAQVGPERLQFYTDGDRQPCWVTPNPVPAVHVEECVGCEVDSRLLLVGHGNLPIGIVRSVAVPIEQLRQGIAGHETPVQGPDWFRGLYASGFALVTVTGLAGINRLMEGAVWLDF